MPTDAPGGAPPANKGKKKPIPTWYYVAGGVGLVLVYYLYEKKKTATAAAATATAAPATATAPAAAGSYGNAGDLASLLPYLNGAQAATTGTTATSGVTPTGEVMGGGGFQPGNGASSLSGATVTGIDGNTYAWLSGQAVQELPSGTVTYIQPTPGVFTPQQMNTAGYVPGTAVYIKANQ